MTQEDSLCTPGRQLEAAVVVRLSADLRQALRDRAHQEDRTLASLLRVAARAYLDQSRDTASGDGG